MPGLLGSWSGWHNTTHSAWDLSIAGGRLLAWCHCTAPSTPHAQVHNSPMAAALAAEIAPPSEVTALDFER